MSSQTTTPAIRVPRQARGFMRVASLLQAAEAVIGEKGYEAATMTEIAGRAGAAIGSLYQFFPTKEAIADALRAQLIDALSETLARLEPTARGADAETLGREMFETLTTFLHDHPALTAISDARGRAPKQILELRIRLRAGIGRILAAFAPDLPAVRVRVSAAVIWQLMRSAAMLEPQFRERDEAIADIQSLVASYLRGIASG